MRIASMQLAIRDDETKEARVERVMGKVAGCGGADLVLLPEIWNTGYFAFDRYHDEAETLDGPTATAAAAQAQGLGRLRPPGQLRREDAPTGSFTNTSVLFDRQGAARGDVPQDAPVRLRLRRDQGADPGHGGGHRGHGFRPGGSGLLLRPALPRAVPAHGRPGRRVLPGLFGMAVPSAGVTG